MGRQRVTVLVFVLIGVLVLNWTGKKAVLADGPAEITEEMKYIALTFDDGPRPGTTDKLLDGLKERGAAGTFFLVGEQAQTYPDLVKRMQREGHQVGNHTWGHVRLEGSNLAMLTQEIEKTETLLVNLLGGKGYWLRPPYGLIAPELELKIDVPMVKWSVDPRDWESRDADKVVQSVLSEVRNGSIVLLHDIYPSSVEAALQIVDDLQAKGYWFVTVEELLQINGVTPQPGVLYRAGDR